MNGLLVDVEKHVPLFTVDTRWSIDAEVVLRHRVSTWCSTPSTTR